MRRMVGGLLRTIGHIAAGSSPPDAPTLSVVNVGDGDAVTASVTGSGTVLLYYRRRDSDTWTAGNSRAGNGDISQTGLSDGWVYHFVAVASSGGYYSLPSREWAVLVTSGGYDAMDDRQFTDSYDLYRPTRTLSATGEEYWAEPDTPTATGLPCLFMPRDMGGFNVPDFGVEQDFDAALMIPASDTLLPEDRADAPDHVAVDGRNWIVLTVTDALGRGLFKRALLRERRA